MNARATDMDWTRFLIDTAAPVLGNLTAMATALAPLRSVLAVRKAGSLGEMNPLPLAFIFLNALTWIHYGLFARDAYIVGPNVVGLVAGTFYLRVAYLPATPAMRRAMDAATSVYPAVLLIVATYFTTAHGGTDDGMLRAHGLTALGSLSVLILVAMYGSPLATLARVVRTRNAASIHAGFAATSLVNGLLWTAYGLGARNDPFVYAPNAIGAAFAAVQLVCLAVWPAPPPEDEVVVTVHGERTPLLI
ncbi:hypothetical protein H9P43_003813 [Blastocladiella emersonii ATCC 22665]|nr:hypothetical protein H9P43_003813 [Blastocladiella emersonii ATCC 22665]